MHFNDDEDIVFDSTGREEYASLTMGFIGINASLEVSTGYDDILYVSPVIEGRRKLTKAEASELADHMIALWTKFKQEYERLCP